MSDPKIRDNTFVNHCGHNVKLDDYFCSICGAKVICKIEGEADIKNNDLFQAFHWLKKLFKLLENQRHSKLIKTELELSNIFDNKIQSSENIPEFGIKFKTINDKVIKLWGNLKEKSEVIDKEKNKQSISKEKFNKKEELLKRKNKLIEMQEEQDLLINSIETDIKSKPEEVNAKMLKILQEGYLKDFATLVEYKIMLFYFFKYNHINENILEICSDIIANTEPKQDNLNVLYSIARFQEKAGDIEFAKNIYKKIIDNFFINYKDVRERYNKL